MRLVLFLAVFCAYAQEPSAVVDGKTVSLSEARRLVGESPMSTDEIFRYYGFINRMAAKGEAGKLAEQSPYKEQLELARKQVLAQAAMNEYGNHLDIPDADIKEYFDKHRDDFATAMVESLLIPLKDGTAVAQAKAAELKAGKDVPTLLSQYAAGIKTIRKGDTNVFEAIRQAVFKLKPGEVTAPIPRPNGIYVFRLQSIAAPDFQTVAPEVRLALVNARVLAWMDEVRRSVTVSH